MSDRQRNPPIPDIFVPTSTEDSRVKVCTPRETESGVLTLSPSTSSSSKTCLLWAKWSSSLAEPTAEEMRENTDLWTERLMGKKLVEGSISNNPKVRQFVILELLEKESDLIRDTDFPH